MHVFILGSGATGAALAHLLRRRGHDVCCGDREARRCRGFVEPRIPCVPVNARRVDSVVRRARGCDLLVNAAPAVFNENVLQAALRLRVHYLDMAAHLSTDPFVAEQMDYASQFERLRKLALINAGAAPGLTNVLAALGADAFDEVTRVRIRLFEDTQSRQPISTWSPEVAFDEAISKPPVYHGKRYRLGRRFGDAEWFRFPPPIGLVRVVLVAQDEVATLPRYIPMTDLDVKAGGNDIERLRRWKRQGKLWPGDAMSAARFPATNSQDEVEQLMRRRVLRNAQFAVAVSVLGRKGPHWREQRRACIFPCLRQLRGKRLLAAPIPYGAAACAAAFIACWPRRLAGVLPPEALGAQIRRRVVADLRRQGCQFSRQTLAVDPAPQARKAAT